MVRRIAAFAIIFILMAVQTYAQGVTTGTITGSVLGKDANSVKESIELKGATIRATHTETGSVYGGYTRNDGRYSLRGLRPGRYSVTATYVGYTAGSFANVSVEVGESSQLNFELDPSSKRTETVTVTAESTQLQDRSKSGSSSTLDQATITNAPSINRSISDLARLNPYTQQSGTVGTDGLAGVSVLGVNSRYNNFQIDGAVSNDLFALGAAGTAGSQANSNFVSMDAIERLRVNVSPYDVRQSGFTGGLINAITRGGTNTYHGSVFAYGRNESMVGVSPDAYQRPYEDFFDYQFGGRVGGPIVENTLLFHVTAEVRLRSSPLDVALNDPNALNNFPVPASVLDEIIEVSKSRYGYDPGTYDLYNIKNNTANIIGRLDWNLNEQNKIQFRYNFTYAIQERNLQRDAQNFSLSSRVNTFTSSNSQAVVQWNTLAGNNAANELRITYTQTNDDRVLSTDPFPEIRIQVGSGQNVVLGPERNSQANGLDQTLITLTDDYTMFLGSHTVTAGTNNELSRFNNLFIPDIYSSLQYPSVSAFADSTANYYRVSYANDSVTNTDQPRALWWMIQVGGYVMDEWDVNDRLRLVGGFRVDVPIFLSTPYENELFSQRFPGRSTSEVPQSAFMLSPRFGFNYDLSGDRSVVLRGGSGVFTGRVAAVWLSNQYSNTGIDLYRAELGGNASQGTIVDANGEVVTWDLSVPPPTPGDPGYPGTRFNTASIALTDHDFRMPQVWRSTLAVGFQIAKGLTFNVEGLYGKFFNQVDYANLNLNRSNVSYVVAGDTVHGVSPVDGRPLYSTNSSDSVAAEEFTQVILMRSRDAGYQWSVSGTLDLDGRNSFLPGFSGSVSYTYGRSEDLNSSTSAVALSQWQFNDVIDPNNATVGRSNFDQPHRVVTNATYTISWTKNISTAISLFYSGSTGRPYSLSYIQDLNGDAASGGNDLLYIPRDEDYNTRVVIVAPGGTDLRTSEQIWDQLMALVHANPILEQYQGKILPRNYLREPWINQLDMKIRQILPAFSDHTFEISLDIQNVLNLLNIDWGHQRYVSNQSYNLFSLTTQNGKPFDSQGRLLMSYVEPVTNGQSGIYVTDNFYSRWRMQLGVRYNF